MDQLIERGAQLWHELVPEWVHQGLHDVEEKLLNAVLPLISKQLDSIDGALAPIQPWKLVLVTLVCTLVMVWAWSHWSNLQEDGGVLAAVFSFLRSMPGISGYIRKEKDKMRAQITAGRSQTLTQLPAQGLTSDQVLVQMRQRQQDDIEVPDGSSQLSGAVYMGSTPHKLMLNEAFCMYATTNPLHADVWPSVRQMEVEVVAMTASMLGGGPGTSVCGAMTSGGTESILLAMKASRDWAKLRRCIRQPEIIIAQSAHAAYIKAAEYFGMRLVTLPVGPDMRLSGRTVARAMTGNTAVVIASAPCFPHGVVDHIQDIAKVCRSRGVCLHVDGCLGGFVLAFTRKLAGLSRQVPPFDFSVEGVTSMSVDTHKFGLAHKGSSVVLYSTPELRAHQFTSITDWSGGLYISPTMAGSRPGGLIATAWAALMSQGEQGYLSLARQLMELADRFIAGISDIPELEVIGCPDMCLVAFKNSKAAPKLNMYKVKDVLNKSGWHCNALQSPPALHFCFTPAHVGGTRDVVSDLLRDLRQAVQQLISDPNSVQGGSAPLYGMANVVPDRRMVGDFLVTFQECQLDS